jgi:dTDP-glucose pyrophosphorylase/predicted transcriptional regulator
MVELSKVTLSLESSIKEAMALIDESSLQIALVIDSTNYLIGTITDGDIRRGLLKGLRITDSIDTIIFRTPTVCNINDNREKILALSLKNNIQQIPLVDNNGKLVGLEVFKELLKSKTRTNKVVLMAGGLGSRLRPLTDNKPKPMLHVGNKPILETIIENFAKHGFTEIILSVNYLSHVIKEYFGDGSKFGVNIEYIQEEKRLGTAGALSLMRDQLKEPFFVSNADLLTNVNYEHLLKFHNQMNANATMCVREYDFQVPYGVVNIENEKILSIDEKPIHSFFVSAGIYMLSPDVLKKIPDDTFFDMPDLFEALIQSGMSPNSFPIREYWLDIGHLNDFERANSEYVDIFS